MSEGQVPRYRALFQLAAGGMGTVHVAERREGAFRRLYALKRLAREHSDEDSEAMFLDEARLAGMLRHPNVVSVLDYGRDEQGPFLIMDLVEGVSLTKIVSAAAGSVPMPLQHVVGIGAQIAEGLSAAHELRDEWGEPLRVVHRDVSPQNVLVGFDGSVRLTDFGIARAVRREASTTTGNVLKGKMSYMSPEQLRFRQPDARSDLFALGVVLFEMAAGQRLYKGDDAALRILEEPPPNLRAARPDVPSELRDLVRTMLSKEPRDRPQSAREVSDALHRFHAELVTKDGRENLSDYIAKLLPSAEPMFKARLREAVGMSLATEPGTKDSGGNQRVRLIAIAAAVVLLLSALGIVLATQSATPAAQPAALTPAPLAPTKAPQSEVLEPPEEVSVVSEEEPSAQMEDEPSPMRIRRRPRRRGSRSKQRSMRPSRMGVLNQWPE